MSHRLTLVILFHDSLLGNVVSTNCVQIHQICAYYSFFFQTDRLVHQFCHLSVSLVLLLHTVTNSKQQCE